MKAVRLIMMRFSCPSNKKNGDPPAPEVQFVAARAAASLLAAAFAIASCLDASPAFAARSKKRSGAGKNAIQSQPAEVVADDVFIYKKGLSYYENSEYARACEYFKYIKEKRPASMYYDMAIYLCGESHVKMGKPAEAVEYYLYLIEKCPKSSLCGDAIHTVAAYYKKQGMSGEAIKYYRKLLESWPESFWAEEARVFLKYNTTGSGESSPAYSDRRIVEEAVTVAPGGKNSAGGPAGPSEAIDLDALGVDIYASGRREYEPVDYGGEDLKLYREGLKFHEYKNYAKARWCYQKLVLKYRNSAWYPNAFFMMARCYLAEKDIKAAIRFESAALIYARDAALAEEIKSSLADLLFGDGQYLLALRYYESMAKNTKDRERLMQIFFMIGECHTRAGNYEMAARAYARVALGGEKPSAAGDKGVSARPPSPEAAPAQAGGPAGNRSVVRVSKTATPRAGFDASEGVREFEAKNYLKCISFFERRLVENPDEAICHWYLGLCFNQLEKTDRAIGSIQKYISLLSAGRNAGTVEELRQALSTLAYIYLKAGRHEEAREQYVRIIGLDPSSPSAASAREAMKRIDVIKKRAGEEK